MPVSKAAVPAASLMGLWVVLALGCVPATAATRVSGIRVVEDSPEGHAEWDALCASPPAGSSAVLLENCRQGSAESEWGINAAGHSTIQGFATQQSAKPGETLQLKVKSTSSNYSIDIYRVGYYRGKGARRVATLADVVPHDQPECDVDEETLLVDCGNWHTVASWHVPADAVTGVCFARLTRRDVPQYWRTDGSEIRASPKFANPDWDHRQPPPCGYAGAEGRQQRDCPAMQHAYGALKQGTSPGASTSLREIKNPFASHVYFVVREAAPVAEMLFQTSDPTWHAYNTYGAPNTYGVAALEHHWDHFPLKIRALRKAGKLERRSFKRSYNTPMLTRDTRSVNMLWGVEYAMIRFLERHGYSVAYQSGVDTDRLGRVQDHRVFLSVGHDEYWSEGQRRNIVAARDSGKTHLVFLSGNEAYWRIRYEDAGRTMAVYKETQASSKLDPEQGEWTGTWRDAVPQNPLGPQPENSVTGTIWTVNAWRSDALEVPHRFSQLRFWRHSQVQRAVGAGQKAVLMRGILGHEWDESLDNGHRPRGGVRLSETTVHNVQHIYDGGSTFDSGSATHHLILYRASSGVLVFGSGTVQWPWGLDPHHDSAAGMPNNIENEYSTRIAEDPHSPDASIQQTTVNLFQDMGSLPVVALLPAHLTLGEAGADTKPPQCRVERVSVSSIEGVPTITAIHGSASDTGGRVASVEVCLGTGSDALDNCKVVEGTSGEAALQWTYTPGNWDRMHRPLLPIAAASAEGLVVACFAVDDSLNIGDVSAPLGVAGMAGPEAEL